MDSWRRLSLDKLRFQDRQMLAEIHEPLLGLLDGFGAGIRKTALKIVENSGDFEFGSGYALCQRVDWKWRSPLLAPPLGGLMADMQATAKTTRVDDDRFISRQPDCVLECGKIIEMAPLAATLKELC